VQDFIFWYRKKTGLAHQNAQLQNHFKNVQIIGCVLAAVLVVVWFSLEKYTSLIVSNCNTVPLSKL
jgi:hypothetical protein